MLSKKDEDKKSQQKVDEISKAFLAEYALLVRKHHRDFAPMLDYADNGISARLVIVQVEVPSQIIAPKQGIITK